MSFLEEYIDKQLTLPVDVNRYLRLIKELDLRYIKAQRKLEEYQEDYLNLLKLITKEKKGDPKKLDSDKQKIERLQKECMSLAQEKMQIADQLYQAIDFSINDLEADLNNFEKDLRSQGSTLQLREERDEISMNLKKKNKLENKPEGKIVKEQKNKDKLIQNAIEKEKNQQFNSVVDSAEPKYCYCDRHSYGEMISCDNPFCEKEWFHFDCAGLKQQPKGKWFCRDCAELKKHSLLQ